MIDTLTTNYQGTNLTPASFSITGATRVSQDYSLPADSSAHEVKVALTRSAVQVLFILSDHNVTLKTNSSGSPTDTISIVANVPLLVGLSANVPQGTSTAASFFSGDITTMFFINGTPASVGNIWIRAIIT